MTTLPAPITAFSPIVTPPSTITPPPSHAPAPIAIGRPDSQPGAPLRGVERMVGAEELHGGADEHLVADRDLAGVDEERPEVHEHARADVDVEAVVDLHRRHDVAALAERAEQLEQRPPAGLDVLDPGPVDQAHEPLRAHVQLAHLGVRCLVELARAHPLEMRRHAVIVAGPAA